MGPTVKAVEAIYEQGYLRPLQPLEDHPEAIYTVTVHSRSALAISAPVPELRLYGLGPTHVHRGQRRLVAADWTYAKPKELLFFLLCRPPQTKEQIGLIFWPDASPAQLRDRFRVALFHLRQALGRPEWIPFEDNRYTFNRSLDYWFDLEAFESHLAQARRLQPGVPVQAIDTLEEAVKLYQGSLLEDITADNWFRPQREAVEGQYMAALLALGQLHCTAGHYAEAAIVYRQAITCDSLAEAAHYELIRCYARLGERRRGIQHYQMLVRLLDEELGLPPAPETAMLHQRLCQGDEI